MIKFVVPAILMFASSQVLAQNDPAQQQQQQQAQQASPKKPRLICHDIEETGSRLSRHRVCMTAQQWKDEEDGERQNVADLQRQSTIPE